MKADGDPKPTDAIADIPSFAGMDYASLEAITEAAIQRGYTGGEVVFLEGHRCAGLHVVQDGWLKAYKVSKSGRAQIVRFVGPGEAFNEIGALAGGVNQATVEAMEPAKVWIISSDMLSRLIQERPPVAELIIRNLANRVIHLMSLVEDLSLRTVVARLARLLLDHSSGGITLRRRWSTQTEMAARLGTVPDVLNRALRNLAEKGFIQIDRRHLKILDRDGLQAQAQLTD